jgi:AAA15 family ATPase/GTPase
MNVKINENKFKEAKLLTNIPKGELPIYNETSLFLTVADASHRRLAKHLVNYFKNNFALLSGLDDEDMMNIALNELENHTFKQRLNELMEAADLGIKSVEKIDINPDDLPDEIKKQLPQLKAGKKLGFIEVTKEIFNDKGSKISEAKLNLEADESAGTKKIFTLSPFIFKTLEKGKILFIDEFDARLHPRLTRKIVELFNSEITNPHNAQLIVVSHDTNLLDAKLLRRDQISLVDKDKYGVSSIKSLIEYKGIRNNASFEKDYLDGKYGAVPFLNAIDNLFIAENLEHA